MNNHLKIIFIFIDGFGIGNEDPETNPLRNQRFPNLQELLAGAIPLDARLGVDGLPQSATGQASLLTGINAAKAMGRHVEGFPPPKLKKLIEQENIFQCLETLDRFLPRVAGFSSQPNHLFLLSSDHGNAEDLTTLSHTKNPVPLIALGDSAEPFLNLNSLVDVTSAVLECIA